MNHDDALVLLAARRLAPHRKEEQPLRVPPGWIPWISSRHTSPPNLPTGTRVAVVLRHYLEDGTDLFSDTHNSRVFDHYNWNEISGTAIMYYKVLK